MSSTPRTRKSRMKLLERYKSAPAVNAGQWNIPKPRGVSRAVWETMLKPHNKGTTVTFKSGPIVSMKSLKKRVVRRGKSRQSEPQRYVYTNNKAIRNEALRRMYRMVLKNVKPTNSVSSLANRLEALRISQKKKMLF